MRAIYWLCSQTVRHASEAARSAARTSLNPPCTSRLQAPLSIHGRQEHTQCAKLGIIRMCYACALHWKQRLKSRSPTEFLQKSTKWFQPHFWDSISIKISTPAKLNKITISSTVKLRLIWTLPIVFFSKTQRNNFWMKGYFWGKLEFLSSKTHEYSKQYAARNIRMRNSTHKPEDKAELLTTLLWEDCHRIWPFYVKFSNAQIKCDTLKHSTKPRIKAASTRSCFAAGKSKRAIANQSQYMAPEVACRV